jgi:hypothetical protein
VRPSPLPLSGFPHILRTIVDYADRNTVVTLLRTSYQLFEIAGPEIYREVYVDHKTISGIFLGANNNPTTGQPEPTRKCGRRANTNRNAEAAKVPALSGHDVGKLGLLKHVKIVTITAHRRSDCKLLSLTVSSLLSPDVVRVVCPRTQNGSFVSTLCGTELCPLLRRINTRKLVFRNLDYTFGRNFDEFERMWMAPSLEEVVYFLPSRRCIETIPSKKVQKIKLVSWEGAEPAPWDWPGDVDNLTGYGYDSNRELVGALRRTMHHSRVLEIYGLETILYSDEDGHRRAKITEQQVRSVKKRLQKKLQKTSRFGREQLIFKTRQQYLREKAHGEVGREEKERWLEEDAFGSASLDDTASSGPSYSGEP